MNPRVSRSSALASKATGLPDREDRRAARGRLRARGDPQRHHAARRPPPSSRRSTTSSSRCPRFAFEKFPGAEGRLCDPHEVRRRGDGDRAHVPRVLRQGDALARARRAEPTSPADDEELLDASRDARPRTASTCVLEALPARRRRRASSRARRRSTPGSCASCSELAPTATAPIRAWSAPSGPSTPAPPSSRRATPYYYSAHERGARRRCRRGAPRRARRAW